MIGLEFSASRYEGLDLPPQAIPSKEKNDAWKSACMDALENIGSRQISENHIRFNDSYRIVQGDFKYKDIVNSSLFLSEVDYWRNQAGVSNEMVHYGFIEPIVNQLVGEYIRKPNSIIISANDSNSTNDYIRAKTERLWNSVSAQLENRINAKLASMGIDPNQKFQSQEEQQAFQQQVDQVRKIETPAEIERDMNQNWRTTYIEWAEATLEEDQNRFDIDEIDKDCLTDYMISGRCFKHFRVGYDYYYPERWHPKQTFCDLTQKYVDQGDYVGYIDYVSPNKVLSNYGHLLSQNQKLLLTRSKKYKDYLRSYYRGSSIGSLNSWVEKGGGELQYVPHASYFAQKNTEYLQNTLDIDLGYNGIFPNTNKNLTYFDITGHSDRTDLLKVIEAYWVSLQRVGHLTLMDETTGQTITELVTDEILREYLSENEIESLKNVSIEQHEANPQPNTIVWDVLPQVWKGVKITADNSDLIDDLYIGVEPLTYQLKGESQMYHTRLPVAGLIENSSFVSRLEEDQKDYNIARNAMRDYMGKELGVFYLMDFTYLPTWLKDMGGEESLSELFNIVRELGILPADGSNTKSNFNQFTSINMDLTQFMAGKLELAKAIKNEALEKVGLSLPRMGTPNAHETATGIQQSVNASYAQTETWYDRFAKFQKKSAEIHLNIAQYMKKDGIDGTVNYVDNDKIRNFINLLDPSLPLRRFRITLENNSKRRSELEMIKQVFLNDNTIDKNLEAVAEVVTSDSISKILEVGRRGAAIRQAQEEQAALRRQEEIKLKEAAVTERESLKQQYKLQQIELEGRIDLHKQAILAMGFSEEKDANNNKTPDVIEAARLAIDELKLKVDINQRQVENIDKKIDSERNARFKEKELSLKEQEINVKKYVADKALEVAKENKTKSEISKNNNKKD